MPAYAYTGLTSAGKTVKGIESSESVGVLKAALKRKGVYLTAVTETSKASSNKARGNEVDLSGLFDRVRSRDVAAMTRLLSTLLIAGVTLPEGLAALTDQVESQRFKGVLSDIGSRVNEGSALADAMATHPKLFPPLYINMVRAGEASGSLETVLIRLADFMDQQEDLRAKITTAMFYPVAMSFVGGAVVSLLMVKVVPQISQMFEDQNAELPLATRFLVASSDFIAGYWWLIILGMIGSVVGFRKWKATEAGRKVFDTTLLKAPVLGDLARKIAVGRFTRTLSTMLASGVQLLDALQIVKSLLGNVVLEDVVARARDDIREGDSVAAALKRSGQFPPLVTHMIAVGERSGQLEKMLEDVAVTYDRETSTAITRATAVLEPLMIIIMGGAVAFIVFSVMTPILQMNQMAGQ
jgi:general secretion pathway protein F